MNLLYLLLNVLFQLVMLSSMYITFGIWGVLVILAIALGASQYHIARLKEKTQS